LFFARVPPFVLAGNVAAGHPEEDTMLLPIGLGVAILVVALVSAIVTRPDTFRVQRSAVINAPAEIPFGYVNDFHQWHRWSPFEKLDPDMRKTFSGPPAGAGAGYAWEGNSKAGRGSMRITESVPARRVAMELLFDKPMKAHNTGEFTFEPAADGVRVTWSIEGVNNFMGKAFSLVMSMDRLVGGPFEEGLAALKAASEADATARVR
jgi:hypothetical protein